MLKPIMKDVIESYVFNNNGYYCCESLDCYTETPCPYATYDYFGDFKCTGEADDCLEYCKRVLRENGVKIDVE